MKMQNIENSSPASPIFSQRYAQNQGISNKHNELYDNDFVNLINGLNESIKEYYKVSKNNITEANSFLSYYEQQGQEIQALIDDISNSNSYQRINEVFEQIPKISEIMYQLKMNTNSNEKNLNLFFEDAKILFKKMKFQRKQKMMEMNDSNNDINNVLNDSYSKSYNYKTANNLERNNLNNLISNNINNNAKIQSPYTKLIPSINNSNPNISLFKYINSIYTKIMKLINGFSEFNYIISGANFEASNKYNNLQNNIKKELNLLMNFIKNNFIQDGQNKILNSIKSVNNINGNQISENKRSESVPGGVCKEIEKLKKINRINEKKIIDLNNQVNLYKQNLNNMNMNKMTGFNSDLENKMRELELENNNLNIKSMKLEQQIIEKDNIINEYQNTFSNKNINIKNNNLNLNNIIKQKDNTISNLQKQLYVYQNNENLLNVKITDLNKKFQSKINQYDLQISQMSNKINSLSKMVLNKNKEVTKFQNENIENKKEIDRLQKIVNSQRLSNISNKSLSHPYEESIQKLKTQINNYENMINQYEITIKELSQNNNNGINMNQNNNNVNMQIHELKMKINQLNKEIINYQRKEKANEDNINKYLKQIEEMNNNIINTNIIIEQKDELIKQLNEKKLEQASDVNSNQNNSQLKKERDDYKFQFEQMQQKYLNMKEILENKNSNEPQGNINDMMKMKLMDIQLENERLQKEVAELKELNNNKIINNNNLLLNNQIINGNNIQQNNMSNNEFMIKMKELTAENQKYKDLLSKLESDINKKNDELEGLRTFIYKLQSQLEKDDDNKLRTGGKKIVQKSPGKQINYKGESDICITEPSRKEKKSKSNIELNKSFDQPKNSDNAAYNKVLDELNKAENQIKALQKVNKDLQKNNRDLQFKLEEKQVEKELSGYRTEDVNFSNYEEEFDLKKMVNGARDKNRSEDINIDYPGVQGIKDKYRELTQNMNMLEEQVKILLSNINCNNNKIKPQVTQICQLMRISSKNIQLILAGKNKRKALGLLI